VGWDWEERWFQEARGPPTSRGEVKGRSDPGREGRREEEPPLRHQKSSSLSL